ncbi:MAG: DUF3160 domain-containing protein [Verrucomicrobiota bacterium]
MKFHPHAACLIIFAVVYHARADEKISPQERALLEREKIVFTEKTWKQIFSAYIGRREPVFVTSDSVLNAWHVLFEDSIRRMEENYSSRLPGELVRILEKLKPRYEGETGAPAKQVADDGLRRARIVLGTAVKLAGGKWSGGEEIDSVIEKEARRVEEAHGVSLPDWLAGEVDGLRGIDYAVFRPTGFYAENEGMRRYFRAVRWLQTVPFHPKRSASAEALNRIVEAMPYGSGILREITGAFREITVPFSEWGDSETLPYERDSISKEPVTLLPALVFPDMELFGKTTGGKRPYPSTLEAAALYGNPLADRLLAGEEKVSAIIREARKNQEVSANRKYASLYGSYAWCLQALSAASPAGAPEFLKSAAWQRKTLNTTLSSWAQFRHTFALQGRENISYFGLMDSEPDGFVEPNPLFFRRLGELAMQSKRYFEDRTDDGLSAVSIMAKAAELEKMFREMIGPHEKVRAAYQKGGKPADADVREWEKAREEISGKFEIFREALRDEIKISGVGSDGRKMIYTFTDPEKAANVMRDIAAGKNLAAIASRIEPTPLVLREPDRWLLLIGICHRLEMIVARQLLGGELDAEDSVFLRKYGESLAEIMLYDENSWLNPKDDAPRVAAVFNQPAEGFLLAGVGRPQEIRVLYPWKGKEIECVGAVMPFRETRARKHMTDEEWKTLLDGTGKPAAPSWWK